LVAVQASLGLRSDRCRELWQVYDAAQAALRPLVERNQVLEQQLDTLLAMHDISSDGSYHAIFTAGEHPPPLRGIIPTLCGNFYIQQVSLCSVQKSSQCTIPGISIQLKFWKVLILGEQCLCSKQKSSHCVI